MDVVLEKLIDERARFVGRRERVKTALELINDSFSTELVAKYSRLAVSEVVELQEWAKKKREVEALGV